MGYWVYIVSNDHGNVIYVGVTNNLMRRIGEHKSGHILGFTAKYKCKKLLYFEFYANVNQAIAREKELKGWTRVKKDKLIAIQNPGGLDMAEDWQF